MSIEGSIGGRVIGGTQNGGGSIEGGSRNGISPRGTEGSLGSRATGGVLDTKRVTPKGTGELVTPPPAEQKVSKTPDTRVSTKPSVPTMSAGGEGTVGEGPIEPPKTPPTESTNGTPEPPRASGRGGNGGEPPVRPPTISEEPEDDSTQVELFREKVEIYDAAHALVDNMKPGSMVRLLEAILKNSNESDNDPNGTKILTELLNRLQTGNQADSKNMQAVSGSNGDDDGSQEPRREAKPPDEPVNGTPEPSRASGRGGNGGEPPINRPPTLPEEPEDGERGNGDQPEERGGEVIPPGQIVPPGEGPQFDDQGRPVGQTPQEPTEPPQSPVEPLERPRFRVVSGGDTSTTPPAESTTVFTGADRPTEPQQPVDPDDKARQLMADLLGIADSQDPEKRLETFSQIITMRTRLGLPVDEQLIGSVRETSEFAGQRIGQIPELRAARTSMTIGSHLYDIDPERAKAELQKARDIIAEGDFDGGYIPTQLLKAEAYTPLGQFYASKGDLVSAKEVLSQISDAGIESIPEADERDLTRTAINEERAKVVTTIIAAERKKSPLEPENEADTTLQTAEALVQELPKNPDVDMNDTRDTLLEGIVHRYLDYEGTDKDLILEAFTKDISNPVVATGLKHEIVKKYASIGNDIGIRRIQEDMQFRTGVGEDLFHEDVAEGYFKAARSALKDEEIVTATRFLDQAKTRIQRISDPDVRASAAISGLLLPTEELGTVRNDLFDILERIDPVHRAPALSRLANEYAQGIPSAQGQLMPRTPEETTQLNVALADCAREIQNNPAIADDIKNPSLIELANAQLGLGSRRIYDGIEYQVVQAQNAGTLPEFASIGLLRAQLTIGDSDAAQRTMEGIQVDSWTSHFVTELPANQQVLDFVRSRIMTEQGPVSEQRKVSDIQKINLLYALADKQVREGMDATATLTDFETVLRRQEGERGTRLQSTFFVPLANLYERNLANLRQQ